jgi:signal transduction histidine kinase/CheY-like chemotaxis protein
MKEAIKDFFLINKNLSHLTSQDIRKQLFPVILIINLFTFPALLLGTIEAIELQTFYTAISFIVFYLPLVASFVFRKKISYKTAVYMLLFTGYSIGTVNIIIYGFSGAGLPIYFVTSVMATLFLNVRAGIITILSSMISMIIVAVLMINNILTIEVDLMKISTLAISWVTAIGVLLFLGGIVIYGFYIIKNNLEEALKYSNELTVDLLKVNKELNKSNLMLSSTLKKANESDRLKSAFLSNMSHEIRTPMNGILGFTSLLNNPKLSKENTEKYISIINKSGQRMLNTINNIIDVSKIDSELMPIILEEIDVLTLVNDLIAFFSIQCIKKGLKLRFDNTTNSENLIVKTDKNKLSSIITNLINNAIKFTDFGTITIGLSKNGEQLDFYVKDTGIGIPKDRKEAIFDRFIQADIGNNRAFQGSGLGLTIVKEYVEMLGGKVAVVSKENEGSTFSFSLPTNAALENEVIESTQTIKFDEHKNKNNPSRKLKFLIAEDDEVSSFYLTSILKSINCEILESFNGAEAVEQFRCNPDVDIILMDLKMPVMDGFEATQEIRKLNSEVIIIIQTAYAFTSDKEKSIKVGCNEYISKPIKEEELLDLINKYSTQ